MKESFIKIVLKVHSKDEFIKIKEEVEKVNIPFALIKDSLYNKIYSTWNWTLSIR